MAEISTGDKNCPYYDICSDAGWKCFFCETPKKESEGGADG